jgi:hypothetical protein
MPRSGGERRKGYNDAEKKYKVTYWCARCHQRHLTITNQEEKDAAGKVMHEKGWRSSACQVVS